MAAVEERIEAERALGEHARLVGELEALVHEQPLRERFIGQLMLALYRSGGQPDAPESYRTARRRLLDELGLEPTGGLWGEHPSGWRPTRWRRSTSIQTT